MDVTALACPQCRAPVPSGFASGQACRYCGAALLVSGAASPPVAQPGLPVDVAVFLVDAGHNKLGVISTLREHVKISLIDAKNRVEHAPSVLVEALVDSKAKALVAAIAKVGGRAEIRQ